MTPRPARVLLLLDSLASEAGTENQLMEIVRRVDPRRVQIFIACMEDSARLQSLSSYATPLVFPARGAFSLDGVRQMRRFRETLRRHSIDIVHAFMVRATIFGVFASQGRVQTILTSRRNLGEWYTPALLRLFRFLNRLTTRVVANSAGARDAAVRLEGLSPDRIDVLYNGVDIARFERQRDPARLANLGIPQNARVIGIVANYRPVKNLPMFLRAAKIIAARFPDTVFLLIGRGPQRDELKQLAGQLGISSRVFFSDDQGDVAAWYPCFDVACLTSRSEGFSNAILEYMASGLPVVATNVGGVGEAIEHGVTGLLAPSEDPAAFAEQLTRVLSDREFRGQLGNNAQARCKQRFDIQVTVRELEDYYLRFLPAFQGDRRA
ncbi:MAG: glycosyltransferase [Acidobacteriota bacterium]